MRLSRDGSVAAVKAAVALVHWDGVDVPSKVLEIINDTESQEPLNSQAEEEN